MLISHFATPWSGPPLREPPPLQNSGYAYGIIVVIWRQCNQLNFDCCLQDDTSGDYRKILLTLTGNQQFIK